MKQLVTLSARFVQVFAIVTLVASIARVAEARGEVTADTYLWKSVKVGGGGFIPGIVFSRAQKGLVYLRSDMGGCYRWNDQVKSWLPLQDAMGESSYFGGESIAPDPLDANVVYIAAGMYRGEPSAILRSRDQGKTWETFPVTFHMGGNEEGRDVGERLAIDPNDTSILYFASRYDGLQRSTDHGEHWQKVESFPLKGEGIPPQPRPSTGGLSVVVFDPASGSKGTPSQSIFVGVGEAGDHHLYHSADAGKTWKHVQGEPKKELFVCKAEIDDGGTLFLTYSNGAGPNGVTSGAVMALNTKSGGWTDITPDKRPDRPVGGYCGLSLDRQHPGTLGVTTLNRWGPVDTVWRTTDGGKTWKDIAQKSERDVSATPFLLWGMPTAKLGWWMAAFAIDPFNSDHAAYATGATIYATDDFSHVSSDESTHWKPWVEGIEQTAIISIVSPTEGSHLLSAFGDIGGFAHDDLEKSPPAGMYDHPLFVNTDSIDYAGQKPSVIVRSGTAAAGVATMAYSEVGGCAWQPMNGPPAGERSGRRHRQGTPALVISADGSTIVAMSDPPMYTRDHGAHWEHPKGLSPGARPVPDRVKAKKFYSIDFNTGKIEQSTDGGETFTAVQTTGLPADIKGDRPTWSEATWPLLATLGKEDDLWVVSKGGLFHSSDGGKTFDKAAGDDVHVEMLSFGKPAPDQEYPALFAVGATGKLKAIWRSDDAGKSWVRLNDDQHQYGTRFHCIAGDPRIFGRVYVGTDGRGILYGEPASTR